VQERYLGKLEPHMDVCDSNGDKIGTIARVYRYDLATVGAGTTAPASLPHDEIIEVKTGLLGLGHHYYVPLSAIEDVTTGCVFVKQPKDAIDQQGWDTRPSYLDELT
jgi:hypothetical protein